MNGKFLIIGNTEHIFTPLTQLETILKLIQLGAMTPEQSRKIIEEAMRGPVYIKHDKLEETDSNWRDIIVSVGRATNTKEVPKKQNLPDGVAEKNPDTVSTTGGNPHA